MDTDSDTHQHVLRAFRNAAVDPEQIRTLQGFETEAVEGLATKVKLGWRQRLTNCSGSHDHR